MLLGPVGVEGDVDVVGNDPGGWLQRRERLLKDAQLGELLGRGAAGRGGDRIGGVDAGADQQTEEEEAPGFHTGNI